MDDIFYFTKTDITLEDIKSLADKFNYNSDLISRPYANYLNIYYEKHKFWQWHFISYDHKAIGFFESEQIQKINIMKPSSIFIISHHINSKISILRFMKMTLLKFGGWVGCDDGTFNVIYDKDNIENLKYPFIEE